MNTPEYLYHYTSLETLALILEKRTLCFNNLLNVDDMEEAEAADIKNFGKYMLVSCWTDEENEMIPMWNLYTKDMQGVRIGLPARPFVKYHYQKGEFNCSSECDLYIDYRQLLNENRGTISPGLPKLVHVNYTDEKEKLCPQIRIEGTDEDVKRFLSGDFEHIKISYSVKELGQNKREAWSFQKEWRYLLWFSPITLAEMKMGEFEKQQEYVRRMEDENQEPPYQRFFLKIRQDAVDQMQVVFGPKMTESQKILAKALLCKHGLEGHWRDSSLRIR